MYAGAQEISTERLNPQTEPLRLEDLENRIINADCMDILRRLPDKCVDLVLTGERFPSRENIQKIVELTGCEVQPNDFYKGE
jgi:hypothetical protein